jgi:hypothetical protein
LTLSNKPGVALTLANEWAADPCQSCNIRWEYPPHEPRFVANTRSNLLGENYSSFLRSVSSKFLQLIQYLELSKSLNVCRYSNNI